MHSIFFNKKYIIYLIFTLCLFNSKAQYYYGNNSNDTIKTYKTQSLLRTGDWYKIKLQKTGVYKLSYGDLKKIGLNNPENVRVYGYGGRQLPMMNDEFNYDDLYENPIIMGKGSDGVFNEGDYILFFSIGVRYWNYNKEQDFFSEHIHEYSNFIYLFLTDSFGKGKRVAKQTKKMLNNKLTSTGDLMFSYCKHKINPLGTGRMWFADMIPAKFTYHYKFGISNKIPDAIVNAQFCTAGRRDGGATDLVAKIYANNNYVTAISTHKISINHFYAYTKFSNFDFNAQGDTLDLKISVSGANEWSEFLIGYLHFNTREYLKYKGGQYLFCDKQTVGNGNITKFSLDATQEISIWDVTKPTNPVALHVTHNNSKAEFVVSTDSLKEFIAFGSEFLTPIYSGDDVGHVANQNLHSINNIDMLIVTHPKFLNEANELADFRRMYSNLKVEVVTPQQIYNEFSSGTPDISAIRNMVRMLHNRDKVKPLKYLLLFGDGTYDNKSIESSNNNWIFTYQDDVTMNDINSYAGDDFFGLLGKGEGKKNGKIDIGIGRFPVNTNEEAAIVVDKTKRYGDIETKGSWRQDLCFIADDEDSNLHLNDAEFVAEEIIRKKHKEFNITKIYLDAYKQDVSSFKQAYPQANQDVEDVIKQGALIIDYVGHGNPKRLAYEQILSKETITKWKNKNKLPIFITASCEVGRFDNPKIVSLGESFVLTPNGGGVAALTTTRVVYAGSNHNLNVAFFKNLFNDGVRLGDVIRLAKNEATSLNKRKFILFGDPSIKVSMPQNKVLITNIEKVVNLKDKPSMLAVASKSKDDTIKALDNLHVSGYVIDKNEDLLSCDGKLYVKLYDKPQKAITLGNDKKVSFPTEFIVQNGILYNGKVSIKKGFFEFDFTVPKDINNKYGQSKFTMYAVMADSSDAIGFYDKIIVGGVNNNADIDNQSPDISLYMNDTSFVNGGVTNESPIFLARISDNSGINTSGIGFGHDIIALLDNEKEITLNKFYISDMENGTNGTIRYELLNLDEGYHTIKLKIWDSYNNPAEKEIGFYVHNEKDVFVKYFGNYPNPASSYTKFYLNHNQSGKNIKITIKVYNLMGQVIATLKQTQQNNSYYINPITWNTTNSTGKPLPNGVYIYTITVETETGLKINKSSKLIISR